MKLVDMKNLVTYMILPQHHSKHRDPHSSYIHRSSEDAYHQHHPQQEIPFDGDTTPTEFQVKWFRRTQETLETFYGSTLDRHVAIQQTPDGHVYSHGLPVAPSSHMPHTQHHGAQGEGSCGNRTTSAGRVASGNGVYDRDRIQPDSRMPHTNPQAEPCPLWHELISCSSTNTGYSIQGLGHRMGARVGTPLAAIVIEIESAKPTVAGIQEHKLGPHDFSHLPGLAANFDWDWIGFPGPKRGQQGLGFFVLKVATILFTKHDRANDCEVATMVIEIYGLVVAVINTYWAPDGVTSLVNVSTCCEVVWQHYLAITDFKATVTFMTGDLNVNMLVDTPKSRYVGSFIADRLQLTRQDMVGDNALDVTRPRTATHLDCIAYVTVQVSTVTGYWNHLWATDDHTSLGVRLEVPHARAEKEKSRAEPRSSPLRYDHKKFTEEEKQRYSTTLDKLIHAGIGSRIETHLRQASTSPDIALQRKVWLLAVDACLVSAAIHKAADSHLKQHRKIPGKIPHWEQKSMRKVILDHGPETRWDKINDLRSVRSRPAKTGSCLPSIMEVDEHGVKHVTYGADQVREKIVQHHQHVSRHDLHDPLFDTEIVAEVEDAVEQIRRSLSRGELLHGAPGTESNGNNKATETLSESPITRDEYHFALRKLKVAEEGAPSSDAVMAWMILWAGEAFHDCFFNLVNLVWQWALIPECWRMAIVRYLKKTAAASDMDISKHRALTLKSILGKFVTRIKLVRLKVILDQHIPPSQVGYQSELGSYMSVWAFRRLVLEQIGLGLDVWILLCDWAKAYDKVWRAMVLLLINAMGVTGKLWMLIDAWIHGTIMTAVFNGSTSRLYSVLAGLGQGCVLSAILFLMFIRTLTEAAPPMSQSYPFRVLVEKLHSMRLSREDGVKTNTTPHTSMLAAMIAADDTSLMSNCRTTMIRLCGCLFRWKRMSRMETNNGKFHLLAHGAKKEKKLAGVPQTYKSVHNEISSIILPGDSKTTYSEESAVLLGCQLRSTRDKSVLWSYYVRKVVPHQLTVQRILHQIGLTEAKEFTRAVVMNPLMDAASADSEAMCAPEVFDRLQRKLWCGGGNSSALGIPCSALTIATHRILGELQWSRRMQIAKVTMWRKMIHHSKRGSWPHTTAQKCLEVSMSELAAGLPISDPVVASIHVILQKWSHPDGINAPMPVGRPVTTKVVSRCIEQLTTEDIINGYTDYADVEQRAYMETWWDEDPIAEAVNAAWQGSGYTGTHLVRGLPSKTLTRATESWPDTHDDDPPPFAPTEHQQEQDDVLRDHLRYMRDDGREADAWVSHIVEGAEREQELQWAREQEQYAPSDDRLGEGDGSLCCELHPPRGGIVARHRWGVLHLIDFASHSTHGDVVDCFLRLLAGCTPTTRAYLCKKRVRKEWKSPGDYTDLDRRRATMCPCGLGVQDSIHVLDCQHQLAVQLRLDVLHIADTTMSQAASSNHPTWVDRPRKKRPKNEDRPQTRTQFEAATEQHMTEVRLWADSPYRRRLLTTLGLSDTALYDCTRRLLVTACMPIWARAESMWTIINQ